MNNFLKMPINTIKGIGEKKAKILSKLGIHSIEDLIFHFPRDYEDRRTNKKICELIDGEETSFEGIITSQVISSRIRGGLTIQKVTIKDETGIILGTWFNRQYLKNVLKVGDTYTFYGRIQKKGKKFEVANSEFEREDIDAYKNMNKIVPVYPLTKDMTQNTLRTSISEAFQMIYEAFQDPLPHDLLQKYNLKDLDYSIRNIHFPQCFEDYDVARQRLAFEELFMLQLSLLSIKKLCDKIESGISFSKVNEIHEFIRKLPFKLTDAQVKVFNEINSDMESTRVMNRLVQGDVGSGKTVLAAMAIFKAIKSGYQSAFMAPTEILAKQHYIFLKSVFSEFGIKIALLTGSLGAKNKRILLDDIKNNNVDLVVGTHALIEESVQFNNLGLVITDEQHRFGVRQRTILSKKGLNTDLLVMTATPIPRTLALILYGDLDISIVDQLPPGRKPIETFVVSENLRKRVYGFISKNIDEGRQVYIVCPLVEESQEIEAKSVIELAQTLKDNDFANYNVGYIYGKMKSSEKEAVMMDFSNGSIDILVSSTVIEVGVNVPNATIMVVENAERFGLAQLHQLRGRVGRGEHQSYCILFNQGKSSITKERLNVMKESNDGFIISEKDLNLRGPGEFFGTRQHGIPELKIANLYRDTEILKAAQKAAREIYEDDPLLNKCENQILKKLLHDKLLKNKDVGIN